MMASVHQEHGLLLVDRDENVWSVETGAKWSEERADERSSQLLDVQRQLPRAGRRKLWIDGVVVTVILCVPNVRCPTLSWRKTSTKWSETRSRKNHDVVIFPIRERHHGGPSKSDWTK